MAYEQEKGHADYLDSDIIFGIFHNYLGIFEVFLS